MMRRVLEAAIASVAAVVLATGGVAAQGGAARSAAVARQDSDFTFVGPMVQGGVIVATAPRGTKRVTLDGVALDLAPDGRFLFAFDRDAKPSAVLAASLSDGRQIARTLSVAPRSWQIERLETLPKIAQPSEEFNRRRPDEVARIGAARALRTDAQGWRQVFLWPAVGRISGMFGAQRIYKNGEAGSPHSGTDIARPTGAPVIAPADGVVILAADSPFTLEGNLLMVDHGMGLNSAFLHLSKIDVKVGDHVRRGQKIGEVGMTGRATGPHLHWSLKWRDARVDPLLVAGPMPVAD